MIDAAFIVLIGFVTFLVLALRFGYKKSLSSLDQQIAVITATVEKAKQTLLHAEEKHSFEAKYSTLIEDEIDEIYNRMQHQIIEIKKQATTDFEKTLQGRLLNSDSLIDRKRLEVMNELQNHITQATINTLKELFMTRLSAKTHAEINSSLLTKLKTILQSEDKQMAQKKL